ncbi:MAG: hypothetical protein H7070_02695 [Saprospiraceae bacterium]|nr:hypothetical protein [Pyrinomonadaceae bacterium]
MAKKFDTNPLDPDFPQRAKAVAASTAPQTPYKTAEFPSAPSSVTEEETRRFGEGDFQAYWQTSQQPAAPLYHAPAFSDMNAASDRKVEKVGMPEKWLIAMPYLPFSIGLVAGIILLLIIPKEENKVRFHAAQGLAAHVGILIVTTILGIVGNVSDFAGIGDTIFYLVTTVMLIVFAIKAWQGKPVHIESVDDLTNFLEEKIGPLK